MGCGVSGEEVIVERAIEAEWYWSRGVVWLQLWLGLHGWGDGGIQKVRHSCGVWVLDARPWVYC